jgi:suppressor for copper-sensitivity B
MQFQNPYFLIFLCIALFYFSIYTLKGDLQISSNILSKLNQKIDQNQNRLFLPNFLSGILTVLLATPCSAPFVGSAISFALSQEILEIFLIFITISLGLALPYFALLIFPRLTYKLPKAGNWMNHIKKLMFLLLLGTLIWLLQILSNSIGYFGSSLILAFLIISIFFFNKTKKSIIALLMILFAEFSIPSFFYHQSSQETEKNWIEFDQKKIPFLIKKNKIVIVNITADWCLTCKINEAMVLNSHEVINFIKQPNVIAMQGDLTKPNQEILDFIKSHNRQGIPFTVIYSKRFPNGILTSELIFKKDLLKLIATLKTKAYEK